VNADRRAEIEYVPPGWRSKAHLVARHWRELQARLVMCPTSRALHAEFEPTADELEFLAPECLPRPIWLWSMARHHHQEVTVSTSPQPESGKEDTTKNMPKPENLPETGGTTIHPGMRGPDMDSRFL
jgi:hypothetical protein